MEKIHRVLIFLVVLLIIIPVIFFIIGGGDDLQDLISPSSSENRNTNPTNQNNEIQDTNSPETGSIGGGGGGDGSSGGGESSGGESSATSDCEKTDIQISYTIINFRKNSTCNTFQESECVDKTAGCSLSIKNLDEITSGQFEIQFTHFESGNESNIFQETQDSTVLSPGETSSLTSSVNFQSPIANNELDCSFKTIETPKKVTCV